QNVDEFEPKAKFAPAIPLPPLAEHFNGEENETEIIVETCWIYRYDKESKVWKQKGHGALKILENNSKIQFRIVMRRDQV
ncbi:unnamed protein product, partial [Lymnaea stagnalis]